MAQKYLNKENGKIGEFVEFNEKGQKITLQFADGSFYAYGAKSFKKHWKLIEEDEVQEEIQQKEVVEQNAEPEQTAEAPKVEKKQKKAKTEKKQETEAVDTVALVANILDELGIEHKDVEKGLSVANNINKRAFEVWKRKTKVRINLNPEMIDFDNFDKNLAEKIGPGTNPNSKLTITLYVELENIADAIKNLCSNIYEFEVEEETDEEAEA